MDTIDWQGSRNPIRFAMEESVENAVGVATFTRNALFARKDDTNPGFGLIFAETEIGYNILLAAMGIKESADSGKTANTKNVEMFYSEFGENLNHYDDLIRPVFGKNTLEYNTILGANRNRFYRGSYEQRETALKGFAVAMGPYPGLTAVAAEVMVFYNKLKDAREAQQGKISGVKTYSADVFVAIEGLIVQMDRNLGWLKYNFALEEDAQAKVNAFFDLSKIMNHNGDKIYPCHVPIVGKVAVCRHLFKQTDRIKITVDGTEDVFISLVNDTKSPLNPGTSYRAVAGTTVEKPASEIFPSFTFKQVMGLNSSADYPSHFEFEIIEA